MNKIKYRHPGATAIEMQLPLGHVLHRGLARPWLVVEHLAVQGRALGAGVFAPAGDPAQADATGARAALGLASRGFGVRVF